MIEHSEILKKHPLLSLLPRAVVRELAAKPLILTHTKGTVLFNEGEPSQALYFVLSGRCEARRTLRNGPEKTIAIYGPGEAFGDRELTGQGCYGSTVRVITDSVLQCVESQMVQHLLQNRRGWLGRFFNGDSNALRAPVSAPGLSPSRLGHIAALISLAPEIPQAFIAEQIAHALVTATGDSVLLLQLHTGTGEVSLMDFAESRSSANGNGWADRLIKAEAGFNRLSLRVTGDKSEAASIAPLLSHLGLHFRYVLLHAGIEELPPTPLLEFLIQCDSSYLLVHPTPDGAQRCDQLLRDVRGRLKGDCSELKPVACLARAESARGFNDLLRKSGAHLHDLVRGCPRAAEVSGSEGFADLTGIFGRDVRRLAREIGRCRIGLALSSGGAKGLAHIGVIQVLEENGIEIDVVAGCSMGAYVAAVWAHGFDGARMEQLALELEGRWGLWKLIDPVFPPRRGFMLGHAVKNRLRRSISTAHFSDLVRPLRVVATNLYTLERKVLSHGEVAAAVHASSAIPGICVPVEIDGETYIDGGVADPLPVDVLIEMGVEKIIAVNTIPPPAFMRVCWEKEREQAAWRGKSRLPWLKKHLNYLASGNLLDIIMRATHGAQIRVAEDACRRADVVLRPLSIDGSWHDFTHPGKYVALGRQVAAEHIAQIKSLLRQETSHENKPLENQLAVLA